MKAKDTFGRDSAAVRYNRALGRARENRLPPGYRSPQPTSAWSPENVDLLERYRTWLVGGGISPDVVNLIHIPTAGHVLGLALKPHSQLDLEADFSIILDYVTAKGLSAPWIKNARNSLVKFRKFLRHERGLVDVTFSPLDNAYGGDDLPAWVVEPLERYRQIAQRGWRPARVTETSRRFWFVHASMWHWFVEHRAVTSLADLKRQHILDYIQHMLTQGLAVSTINNSVRSLHSFLFFLQDQDFAIPQALLRLPTLKEPERLPRFLTDDQVRLLRDEVERVVADAKFAVTRRDALLVRAAFYLLWQAGLRLGEVEELLLEDLDLTGRKLMVRNGKGQKDRVVYLTETSVQAIQAYLPVRGQGTSDHLFLYRHHPVRKDLIRCRIKAAGERVGVKVSPHQLRHTCATQLLNAGCKVTSIQKLLGHRKLDTTLGYARVHDRTVSADFYAAMERIEKQLELAKVEPAELLMIHPFTRAALLALSNRLAEPELKPETRLELVEQLQNILNGKVRMPAEEVTA